LSIGNAKIEVIATPGHTASSVCFYRQPSDTDKQGYLFTGDTLFAGGCGRIFECSAATMHQSLQKLAALPSDTLVYPGHDYTLENYQFAIETEYANEIIKQRLGDIIRLHQQGKPLIPSTIEMERKTNVFLLAKTERDFAALRKLKDVF
jgi:hydroxyacylglutathione hydrolase